MVNSRVVLDTRRRKSWCFPPHWLDMKKATEQIGGQGDSFLRPVHREVSTPKSRMIHGPTLAHGLSAVPRTTWWPAVGADCLPGHRAPPASSSRRDQRCRGNRPKARAPFFRDASVRTLGVLRAWAQSLRPGATPEVHRDGRLLLLSPPAVPVVGSGNFQRIQRRNRHQSGTPRKWHLSHAYGMSSTLVPSVCGRPRWG